MRCPSDRYLNRELTWLEYTQRWLDQATDQGVPLLERLRCIALIGAWLDEFFMVRVAGLKLLVDQGCEGVDLCGWSPAEQLDAVGERTRRMVADVYACLAHLESEMAQAGLKRFRPDELSRRQLRVVEQVFESEIASVLSPLAVPSPNLFPSLANQALSICVRLRGEEERFVVIPFGGTVQRIMTLYSEGGYAFMLLEDAVAMFAERLFPAEDVIECIPFRVTYHATPELRRDLAGDLISQLPDLALPVPARDCIRLELDERASNQVRAFLLASLHVTINCTYTVPGPLDIAGLAPLARLPGFDKLKYETWSPQPSPDVDLTTGMFDTLSRHDVLLFHPYESFEPVVRLLEEAADDPDVVAIKQTLYGSGGESSLVRALQRAAENDKYVTAIIELKPRQGQAYRMEWARQLEQASVQVIYGVRGLRTHAKICIIVRREPTGIQRYVHFGTGDYNEQSARESSDLGLLTADPELGADATRFFNALTSNAYQQQYHKIHAAPVGLREKLIEMIRAEIQWKKDGNNAFIAAKLNALGDPRIIDALYEASQAGVHVHLNVCGVCCLRPGVPELSENIRVISIVDRFYEHARIFRFHHGGSDRVFISSADWMPRNLDRRVELLVPVETNSLRRRLISILETYFHDNVAAAHMRPDGTYRRRRSPAGKPRQRCQRNFHQAAVDAVKKAEQSRRTVFEPHRAPSDVN